ncbi:long-chain-fatty-acid--CoA ligase [Rhodococcus opacus]|uniref:Long-chain-fatty-acid--CoA ligase n=1 Tax=Rhodococcus opacus TaxID=37919 RepID=A0AAX3YHK0_RHOOP|nr:MULTISPECIES: long-chain-fatty-acid--CoA ligase [Rhodococcus]MCZ4585408.1 long-chain-fatty-acid--CoA ligase [Rhodococcus opacus]MDI9935192.1 long-chain-fatty-acid--CoA ligase [Rhodococcus sp. IEGM 1351]MDJ0414232.1 long-chain-fatty-acid--CoA ligase [Rhodococcus opacus]UNN03538.1 long-chain-fatty-acid--CoA ligase [Rhodococcus opacus]WLF48957.1 long-chain-fatty-acid--CoA ligase [Rhodococcus opacus]
MRKSVERVWLSSYAEGVPADIEIPETSLVDMFDASVARFGPRPALEFFAAELTYTELDDRVQRAAEGLRRLGVSHGDRVALIMPNCPEHVVAFYAVLRIGGVVVEHNPLYTSREMAHQLADHGAKVAIAWDKVCTMLREFSGETALQHVVAVNITQSMPLTKRIGLALPIARARKLRNELTAPAPAAVPWKQLLTKGRIDPAYPRPTVGDLAAVQYTSGTTGTPKGAMLSHRNLAANAQQGRAWVPGLVDGEEVVYAVLPMFHAYGLTLCLTFAMSIGARLVLFPKFDVDLVLAAAKRHPPTFLPAVPPIYERLARAAQERGVDLTSARYAISGAMPLPAATLELWETVTGGLLVEGYGLTETSPVALGNPIGLARRPGAVGVPFPSTEIRVVHPDNPIDDVEPGERGELLIRGPQVFTGYWNKPEKTREALLEGGWFRTGDIVQVDPGGFVTVVDRIKELIITGGFNVMPSEVEEALRLFPGVTDVAVVGLPTPSGSEEVVAAVVASESEFDAEAAREHCRTHLTAYKVPRKVVVVEDLPRSQIGKVLRRVVRESLMKT